MLGVLAYFVFALHDAAIKWLVADIPVWQVLFIRSGTILVVCLAVGRRALLERAAASSLKRPLAFRGSSALPALMNSPRLPVDLRSGLNTRAI